MTLYRGRVDAAYGGLMDAINRSLPVDIRLLPYDLLTNRAWAAELARLGALTAAELAALQGALDEIEARRRAGAFREPPGDEDVHTLVERLLTEQVGAAGAKIHAGRSRNDQVATDVRMFAADRLAELGGDVRALLLTLQQLADRHVATPLAGATHLQPAQPITLGFWLLSLAFPLQRDLGRIADAHRRTNRCPLGAGALAGSGFAVDRQALAAALGFDGVCENAMDAVSDRDFAQEIAAVCAMLCGHLSRYAAQFVIWASPAFGFVRFADEWSTGSSMMPQKRNPDAMELVRGKAARCLGAATSLLCLSRGLVPSYSKDLQEDKEPLFDALDTARLCVRVFDAALATAAFDADRMAASLTGDLLATDVADALATGGLPFRQAHERVGAFVAACEAQGPPPATLTTADWRSAFPELSDIQLGAEAAVARRAVEGGTAADAVRRQIALLAANLAQEWRPRARLAE